MPYGQGWHEKGVQFGGLFLNYILFGVNPITPITYDKTVPYGAFNENKTVPYGILEENTNG